MTPVITKEMVEQIETLLKHGSRVELLIEQGKVTIVEIKRKMRYKQPAVKTVGSPMGL